MNDCADDDDDALISNSDLRPEHIPGPEAGYHTIALFALTFDGYTRWGSFVACADIANAGRARTLDKLRTCLFFEQRRFHHFGEVPFPRAMRYIRGLLVRIRKRLEYENARRLK
jgi:hypothetical protein